jgi:transcriptional regulator
MYNLPHFKDNDQCNLFQFLENNPFAFLIGSTLSGQIVATQIPMLLEEKDGQLYVQGHIMRNADHHKAFLENPQVLAVFTGPHAYISATWYSNPQMGSTWNYMSIHVRGTIRFLSDEALIQLLKKLTLKFEQNNISSPSIFDNLPEEYVNNMIPAITAFEIRADDIQHVFKLSQNRDAESYLNIIKHLEEKNDKGNAALVAEEMKRRYNQLFLKDAD